MSTDRSQRQDLDRLYELLPAIHRRRDAEQGEPLRALLRVIAEQVNLVEDDIAQLYENWFIETCEDWAVPYIGDLVNYRLAHEAGIPRGVATEAARRHDRVLIPRREVANTVRYRHRKGTLALLEDLALDVAGWPARAVEFYRLLGATQSIRHPHPPCGRSSGQAINHPHPPCGRSSGQALDPLHLQRGRSADIRQPGRLAKLNGPFDPLAHTVDVRPIGSRRFPEGRYNLPNIGLFVCRLLACSSTRVMAYHVDNHQGCYTFSPLGHDQPLYSRPLPETDPEHIAEELNLPLPISRHDLRDRFANYYGTSFELWIADPSQASAPAFPAQRIVVADLGDWSYRPKSQDQIALDPELGRIAFAEVSLRKLPKAVWVSCHYGFPAEFGGGEYRRNLDQGCHLPVYYVAKAAHSKEHYAYHSLSGALEQWRKDANAGLAPHAAIEIADNGIYSEQPEIRIKPGEALEIRAAQGCRPLLRLLNENHSGPDVLRIFGAEEDAAGKPGCVGLDGLLVTGRGLYVEGRIGCVRLRHCTLVPGWDVDLHCEPAEGEEPSIELVDTTARLRIEHSIAGSILVRLDKVKTDPIAIEIRDSVIDATDHEWEALSDADCGHAHAELTLLRSTVIGRVYAHAIALAENSLLWGEVSVARRQIGCMRFCYVPPGSRTPRRYGCQPDGVEAALRARAGQEIPPAQPTPAALENERLRMRPSFTSTRYGHPAYCQLGPNCAEEIRRGADDEAEMGVYHDLFQPQREANLRARLDEYTPAGAEAGILFIN